MDVACSLLFPDHLHLRALLRLAATSSELRFLVHDALLYVARHHCKVMWKRLRHTPPARVSCLKRFQVTYGEAHALDASCTFWCGTDYFKARPPTTATALKQLRSALCRECFRPTRATAIASSGRTILVCRDCSKKEDSFSCLVDRRAALRCGESSDGFRLKNACVERILASLSVPRRGGNRAKLYWKHEVVQRIADHQERCAKTVAK